MLNNGAKWYNFSPPRLSFIAPPLTLGAGIRHVAEVLDSYFDSEHLDESLLLEYAGRLGNRTVFKRLGYLLETLGIKAPALVRACREQLSSGISLLDPSMPGQGPTRRRWNLRLNATILSERIES